MRTLYILSLLFLPFFAQSQQQLFIKGIHPNFYVVHNVSPNETYASIAKLYNLTSTQLATYNDLSLHDGKVFARTLRIPLTAQNFIQRSKTTTNDVLIPVDYMLIANEPLTNVSARFKVSTVMLADMNNVTSQQIYALKKLTVGYLRVKPEVASFFGNQIKPTDLTKRDTEIKKQDTEEKRAANGVRLPKSRTDEKQAEENNTQTKQQDTIAAVQPNTTIVGNTLQKTGTPNSNRLKVFVDCINTWCDRTFIRTEINIVDFLLDRVASDVHLLITSQRNGNGGIQYQMIFYGQNKFRNIKDTLRLNIDPNATEVESRDELVKYIKMGLTPFILKTDYAKDITINMKKSQEGNSETSNANTKDKWNYWVFNAGANGNVNLQELVKDFSFNGRVSANRITDKIKISFRGNAERNITKFYDDVTKKHIDTADIIVRNYSFNHSLVKSLSKRWSAAYETYLSNDTFSNNKRRIYFAAGIEYAIFPYKEVNNRFFTINYNLNVRQNQYYETTLYGKKEEILYGHELSANIAFKQKWGSINSELEYRSYLHDFKLNRINMYLNVDVRVTGGLSVFGYMFGGLVHDQVELIGRGASAIDILLRRRLLASTFNFNSGFGINYRFGSKLNNFVNPRFDN